MTDETLEIPEMAVFELTVRTAVRGYHIYKEVWTPAIGEEFVCRQERDNDHDRHAVSVHKEGDDVLGHLPREISSVAFFLEHDGSCRIYTAAMLVYYVSCLRKYSIRCEVKWRNEGQRC